MKFFGDVIFIKEINNNKIIMYFKLHLTIILIISSRNFFYIGYLNFQAMLFQRLWYDLTSTLLLFNNLNSTKFSRVFRLADIFYGKVQKRRHDLTEPHIFFKSKKKTSVKSKFFCGTFTVFLKGRKWHLA